MVESVFGVLIGQNKWAADRTDKVIDVMVESVFGV
jgi:hypothetical protein